MLPDLLKYKAAEYLDVLASHPEILKSHFTGRYNYSILVLAVCSRCAILLIAKVQHKRFEFVVYLVNEKIDTANMNEALLTACLNGKYDV